MSTLSFGGLASGLDTNAIIDAVMAAERIPLTQIQSKKTSVDAAQSTISSIASRFSTLKSAATALSTTTGFAAYKASSGDAAIVATATGAATAGSFDIKVTQLAQEQRTYSRGYASNTTALGVSGPLGFQVGSATAASIDVAATDSLVDIATKLNSSGQRLAASVVYDGTNYKLQVRGLDSGDANTITFDESTVSLGLTDAGATVQQAKDALLDMDGMTIRRSTNQITGLVPGVTLALTKTTTTPVRISVASDPAQLTDKVKAFVTAYNDIVSASQSAAGWGNFKATNTILAGDSTLRSALDKLARSIGGVVPGTSGKFTTLGSIGLHSTRDGKLELDETKLKAALEADPTSVQKLFVSDTVLGSTGAMVGVMTAADQIATNSNSLLKTKTESLSAQSRRLDDDAAAMDRRMSLMESQMRERFTQLELLMSKYKALGGSLSGLTSMAE